MKTMTTADFDPRFPYAVLFGAIVEGTDLRERRSCCCLRAAEDEARTRRAMGRPNVEVVALRQIPTKGAHGGWRLAAGDAHRCTLAPRVDD